MNENAYANDEFTQFSNEVFANSRNVFLPAYDIGGVLVWTLGGVMMNVGENADGNSYDWYAAELAYHLKSKLGEGNYRVMVNGNSDAFLNPAGTPTEPRDALNLSFDQQFGPAVGAFLRVGWGREQALVDYSAGYSGGLGFSGSAWGRVNDNIGIAYAYLEGGNADLRSTQAVVAYYRFGINDSAALTADVQ